MTLCEMRFSECTLTELSQLQQRYVLVHLRNFFSLRAVFIKESGVRPLDYLVRSCHLLTDATVQQDDMSELQDAFVLRLSTNHHRLSAFQ
jgi:hypothetical protein